MPNSVTPWFFSKTNPNSFACSLTASKNESILEPTDEATIPLVPLPVISKYLSKSSIRFVTLTSSCSNFCISLSSCSILAKLIRIRSSLSISALSFKLFSAANSFCLVFIATAASSSFCALLTANVACLILSCCSALNLSSASLSKAISAWISSFNLAFSATNDAI